VEHTLQQPLVQNHAGMGGVLQTYYRRKGDGDNGHVALANKADGVDAWQVGQVGRCAVCTQT
jgi:hypothetical protein